MRRTVGVLVAIACVIALGLFVDSSIREFRKPSTPQIDRQYRRLAELQAKVNGQRFGEMVLMRPTQNGVGILFRVGERRFASSRENPAVIAADVRAESVYRNSTAGRVGVLPGDLIRNIGGEQIPTVIFDRGQVAWYIDLVERNLQERASTLFKQAPQHYTLAVERNGKELHFELDRGPIAPEMSDYLDVNLPIFEERMKAAKPLVDKMISRWSTGPQNQVEFQRRESDLEVLEEAVGRSWHQIAEYDESLMVPDPPIEVVAINAVHEP